MHIFNLEADIKLLSLNQAFSTLPNGRRCKSPEYVRFSRQIAQIMRTVSKEFMAFDDAFDRKRHEIHGRMSIMVPDLYTKDGMISKNSGDIDNIPKCLLDNVLVRKIDDSAIVSWKINKYNGPKYMFQLQLEITERAGLCHSF